MRNDSNFVSVFWGAPDDALFSQKEISPVLGFSEGWLEHGRLAGHGPLFRKVGRKCLYAKRDVVDWLNQHQRVQSTAQYAHTAQSMS